MTVHRVFDLTNRSLYCDWDSAAPKFYISQDVDQPFFDANRCEYPAGRGPFPNLKAYVQGLLLAPGNYGWLRCNLSLSSFPFLL
jgi:hypothetical protein